jgi:CDP-6-deoxy-D-xylo-4-hexulose-3-dehydrase
MVWTGNVTRQPAFKDVHHRVAPGGLANADRVMETGLILPCNHALDDDGIAYICETADAYVG